MKMSSLGGQWRVIRHYLSLSNVHAEVEKLLQRIRPASPDQWDIVINKIEKAISARLMAIKEVETDKVATSTAAGGAASEAAPAGAAAGEAAAALQPGDKAAEPAPPAAPAAPAAPAPPHDYLHLGLDVDSFTVQGLLQGLRLKKDLTLGKISEPTWKSKRPTVNKQTSIESRTAYVVSALAGARSDDARERRAEDFVLHIHQYPEAALCARKCGAVRTLARAREGAPPELRAVLDEALALMGEVGPPRGRGPRVLALDGGGVRGLVAVELLRRLEALAGRPVRELFDYVVGVSTGAVVAALVAAGGSLEEAAQAYGALARETFGRASYAGLVWSHAYYDTAAWERLLRARLGPRALSAAHRRAGPALALVSSVAPGPRPFLFRSYGAAAGAPLWAAVRASAAAPAYFEEFTLDGLVHQDGGLVVNNPTGVGVCEARRLWGGAELARAVVVSVGTGRAAGAGAGAAAAAAAAAAAGAPTSWRDKFNRILDSATDTEGTHRLLAGLLPPAAYFRFNPPLRAPCALDETDPARLRALRADTDAYCRRNLRKLQRAAAALARPRAPPQRLADWLRRRALLHGLRR